MNIYEQIANEIESDYLAKKNALALLEEVMKKPVSSPIKATVEVVVPAKKAERTEPKLTVPCQVKTGSINCSHRVHASTPPCVSCTKKACRKCMKRDTCKECMQRGEN